METIIWVPSSSELGKKEVWIKIHTKKTKIRQETSGKLLWVEEEEVELVLPCESAGDVRHDWRVQQHLQRTTVQSTATI